MNGTLDFYSQAPERVIFSHAPCASNKHLICLPGLGEGLLAIPYLRHLQEGVNVHQILLKSSCNGFGDATLASDALEIATAVAYLRKRIAPNAIVGLLGFSTGCQQVMTLLSTIPCVDFAVLQAPVSDREYIESVLKEELPSQIATVKQLSPREYVPRHLADIFGAGVTAQRWLSLVVKGGADDLFSSDLSDDETRSIWSRVKIPMLVLHMQHDEYVPKHVDQSELARRWTQCADIESKLVSGHHKPAGPDIQGVADAVLAFIGKL